MVLHIVQIQFIAEREAECVPTHTAEKERGSYSGVRVGEEWLGLRTTPTVQTKGEQIYNISNNRGSNQKYQKKI